MLKLKEFFTEKLNSVIFMWIGLLLAVISILIMFAPGLNVIGHIFASKDLFFNQEGFINVGVGAWPVFMGYMMILVSGLIMGIIALPFVKITVNAEKGLLITAIALAFIGSILVMCIKPIVCGMNNIPETSLVSNQVGPFFAGAFGLLTAGCGVAACIYDWR